MTLDRRRNAIREDLADARLGDIGVRQTVEPVRRAIVSPLAPCHRRPAEDAPVDTEFLAGEPVDVFDEADGWSWCQSAVDSYVGYVRSDSVGATATSARQVTVPLALVFPEPSIKAPPVGRLPMGARVSAGDVHPVGNERFHAVPDGYVLAQHLAEPSSDWVSIAETFRGTPYLWGGKSWYGIDCSGLVQLALQMIGQNAPRDSDMQAEEIGAPIDGEDAALDLERGDLVFWRGHVGIMLDGESLLHANGYHHATAVEALDTTRERLAALGLKPTAYRRLG